MKRFSKMVALTVLILIAVSSARSYGGDILIRYASRYPDGISIRVGGRAYMLQQGEQLRISIGSATEYLYVWECLAKGSAFDCNWDGPYTVAAGRTYDIVDSPGGPAWNLSIVEGASRRSQPATPRGHDNGGYAEEACTPKINVIFVEHSSVAFSNTCTLTIDGSCFPMNFELWIDGNVNTYSSVSYEGETRLKMSVWCFFSDRKWHYVQVKDRDTGKKSNIYKAWY
jgi:hypothetical protein